MIWIFHRERADAGSCEDYEDLFQYITLKLQQDHSEFEQVPFEHPWERPWSFTFFTPREVSILYNNTQQLLLTETVKEAYEKELGFIAFVQGDCENPLEILGTPSLDIEGLKKQWCLNYCDAHDYIVVENFADHSNDFAQSQSRHRLVEVSNDPQFPQGGAK